LKNRANIGKDWWDSHNIVLGTLEMSLLCKWDEVLLKRALRNAKSQNGLPSVLKKFEARVSVKRNPTKMMEYKEIACCFFICLELDFREYESVRSKS